MRETKAGRPERIACATGLDAIDWRRIGGALEQAKLPGRKKPDVVYAWVALSAAKHGSAVIFISDSKDMQAYLDYWTPATCMSNRCEGRPLGTPPFA